MKYSYREVFIGANAKMYADWSRSSGIVAAVYETIRDSKKHPSPFTPDMWHPYMMRREKPAVPQVEPLEGLRMMYNLFSGGTK